MPAPGDCIDGVRDGLLDGLFDMLGDALLPVDGDCDSLGVALFDPLLFDGDALWLDPWLGPGLEELLAELLDEAEVGTGGGGGVGGTFWNNSTAMSRPVRAMKIVSSHATTVVDQPTLSRRPGHGSGQARTRPGRVSSIQCNRKFGPATDDPERADMSTASRMRRASATAAADPSWTKATHGARDSPPAPPGPVTGRYNSPKRPEFCPAPPRAMTVSECRWLTSPANRSQEAGSLAAPWDNRMMRTARPSSSWARNTVPEGIARTRTSSQNSSILGGSHGSRGRASMGHGLLDIAHHLTTFQP